MKTKNLCSRIIIVTLLTTSIMYVAEAWAVEERTINLTGLWRKCLQGSRGNKVAVYVTTTDKALQGYLQTLLRTDVELELRNYGIKVLTARDSDQIRGIPSLDVRLVLERASTHTKTLFGAFTVEHNETASLKRNATPTLGICWTSGPVLVMGDTNSIRQAVIDVTRNYINDYLAANPKEQSVAEKGKTPKDD